MKKYSYTRKTAVEYAKKMSKSIVINTSDGGNIRRAACRFEADQIEQSIAAALIAIKNGCSERSAKATAELFIQCSEFKYINSHESVYMPIENFLKKHKCNRILCKKQTGNKKYEILSVTIKEGSSPKMPVLIRKGNCPADIEPARCEWEKRQYEYGDVGGAVIGAGFSFKYDGLYYWMPPQGHWQGNVSWEASRDIIKQMLIDAGCIKVIYKWGVLD